MPSDGINSFHVYVDDKTKKLEETYHAPTGKTYIAMPFTLQSTYQVEFEEEEPGGGTCRQKWPVTPYQVIAETTADTHMAATLYIDGQEIDSRNIKPPSEGGTGRVTFRGIPTAADEEREMLFSLPRFVSRRESERNQGRSLPPETLQHVGTISERNQGCSLPPETLQHGGTIRVSFRPYSFKGIERRPVRDIEVCASFVQANKKDCTARGAALGDDPGKFAASTRAGRATRTPRAQVSTRYCGLKWLAPPADMEVHYRTQHYLVEHRIIANPHAEEARTERDRKRAARRNRNQGGGTTAATAVVIE